MSGRAAPRRVFLHVGSPKTGTTFLQNVLWAQRDVAAAQGLLLPLDRFFDHFQASLDVRGVQPRPGAQPVAGTWQRIVDEAARWDGAVLVSHELLAAATAEQAGRAIAAFGASAEVHVVLTARDLVRQIPAEWQEHVKHRSSRSFPEFVAGLREDPDKKSWFWQVQDFADVLERWGRSLPASQVHVVTVPPSGTTAQVLWERFASLLGLDASAFDTDVARANTSLGVEQAEVLRRLNIGLGDRLPIPGPYPRVVKDVLAHRVLAGRPGTPLALGPDDVEYAVERSRDLAKRLESMGVDVVGFLDDLIPDTRAVSDAWELSYSSLPDQVVVRETMEGLIGVLEVLADRRAQERYDDLMRRVRDRPVRFALLQVSEHNQVLRRLRSGYYALRRRSPGA